MEVQSRHNLPIPQGKVAERPKQELWALGRKRVELVLSPVGSAAGATFPARERGWEQIIPDALPRGVPGGAGWSANGNPVERKRGRRESRGH